MRRFPGSALRLLDNCWVCGSVILMPWPVQGPVYHPVEDQEMNDTQYVARKHLDEHMRARSSVADY